jgi:hypothetical protein
VAYDRSLGGAPVSGAPLFVPVLQLAHVRGCGRGAGDHTQNR